MHINMDRLIRKSIRKKHYSVEKQAKDLISSPKRKTNIERFSGIMIREMWIKAAMRYDNTSTNMTKFNSGETKCWWECETTETFIPWLVTLGEKSVLFTKGAILLLWYSNFTTSYYSQLKYIHIYNKLCTKIFIAVLLITSNWKQPKTPTERVNKLGCSHKMRYHRVKKWANCSYRQWHSWFSQK